MSDARGNGIEERGRTLLFRIDEHVHEILRLPLQNRFDSQSECLQIRPIKRKFNALQRRKKRCSRSFSDRDDDIDMTKIFATSQHFLELSTTARSNDIDSQVLAIRVRDRLWWENGFDQILQGFLVIPLFVEKSGTFGVLERIRTNIGDGSNREFRSSCMYVETQRFEENWRSEVVPFQVEAEERLQCPVTDWGEVVME
jgi:hypothetical protein